MNILTLFLYQFSVRTIILIAGRDVKHPAPKNERHAITMAMTQTAIVICLPAFIADYNDGGRNADEF